MKQLKSSKISTFSKSVSFKIKLLWECIGVCAQVQKKRLVNSEIYLAIWSFIYCSLFIILIPMFKHQIHIPECSINSSSRHSLDISTPFVYVEIIQCASNVQ